MNFDHGRVAGWLKEKKKLSHDFTPLAFLLRIFMAIYIIMTF